MAVSRDVSSSWRVRSGIAPGKPDHDPGEAGVGQVTFQTGLGPLPSRTPARQFCTWVLTRTLVTSGVTLSNCVPESPPLPKEGVGTKMSLGSLSVFHKVTASEREQVTGPRGGGTGWPFENPALICGRAGGRRQGPRPGLCWWSLSLQHRGLGRETGASSPHGAASERRLSPHSSTPSCRR